MTSRHGAAAADPQTRMPRDHGGGGTNAAIEDSDEG